MIVEKDNITKFKVVKNLGRHIGNMSLIILSFQENNDKYVCHICQEISLRHPAAKL